RINSSATLPVDGFDIEIECAFPARRKGNLFSVWGPDRDAIVSRVESEAAVNTADEIYQPDVGIAVDGPRDRSELAIRRQFRKDGVILIGLCGCTDHVAAAIVPDQLLAFRDASTIKNVALGRNGEGAQIKKRS